MIIFEILAVLALVAVMAFLGFVVFVTLSWDSISPVLYDGEDRIAELEAELTLKPTEKDNE
jgi:hypothetical protein